MHSNQDSFKDRLRRIEEMRGPLEQPAAPTEKKSRGSARKPAKLRALLTATGVVFAMAIGMVVFVTTVPPEKLKSVLAPDSGGATVVSVEPAA